MGVQETSLAARMRRWLLLAIVAVTPVHAAAETTLRPDQGARLIEGSFFGMHVRYAVTRTPWPNVAFYGWRVITPETEWRGLQPTRDSWDFRALDRAVELAARNEVEVLLTLGQTPKWAAARPEEVVPNGPGASSEPGDFKDWENYVRTVALRYKGRIRLYELWNEPRFREVDPYKAAAGFTGTAAQLVQMGRIARRVLLEIDPTAKLVSPGIDAAFVGLPRLSAWLSAGGSEVSDIYGYHFYLRPPERMPELYLRIRQILREAGEGGKQLWITETGYLVDNPEQPAKPSWAGTDYVFGKVLTVDELAAYVARAHVLMAAVGLERFYWYSWDIRDMGLTRGVGTIRTAATVAYEQTMRWLKGATIHGCRTDAGTVWVCELSRPQAGRSWIVWSTKEGVEWTIPSTLSVVGIEMLDGTSAARQTNNVRLGEKPILLRETTSVWGPEGA